MRRSLFVIGAVFLIIVVLAVAGQRWLVSRSREPGPASFAEGSSQEGAAMVRVDGTVVPSRWVRVSFAMGGDLTIVTATVGAQMASGDALAALDTRELEISLQSAEADRASARALLDRMRKGPEPTVVKSAQALYDAATAAYSKLAAGLSAQDVAILEADLRLAERAVQQAQAAYDSARNRPDIGARPEAMQLEEATLAYQRARASYQKQMAGPDQAALAEAHSRVVSSQAQLEALLAGPSEAELRSAEASVAKAEAAVAQAHTALHQAVLRSPISGTVTSVRDASAGSRVAAGETVATVADMSQMQVEILELDDWGAATVTLNQVANMLVPALSNRRIRGSLAYLSPEPTIDPAGTAAYKAIVTLDKPDPDLRWGMTVRVELDIPGGGRGR